MSTKDDDATQTSEDETVLDVMDHLQEGGNKNGGTPIPFPTLLRRLSSSDHVPTSSRRIIRIDEEPVLPMEEPEYSMSTTRTPPVVSISYDQDPQQRRRRSYIWLMISLIGMTVIVAIVLGSVLGTKGTRGAPPATIASSGSNDVSCTTVNGSAIDGCSGISNANEGTEALFAVIWGVSTTCASYETEPNLQISCGDTASTTSVLDTQGAACQQNGSNNVVCTNPTIGESLIQIACHASSSAETVSLRTLAPQATVMGCSSVDYFNGVQVVGGRAASYITLMALNCSRAADWWFNPAPATACLKGQVARPPSTHHGGGNNGGGSHGDGVRNPDSFNQSYEGAHGGFHGSRPDIACLQSSKCQVAQNCLNDCACSATIDDVELTGESASNCPSNIDSGELWKLIRAAGV